jgi:hypothetical protein
MTDFGADMPYAKAMDKLVEHYGVVLCESTIRRVTHKHAQTVTSAAGVCRWDCPKQLHQGKPLLSKWTAPWCPR